MLLAAGLSNISDSLAGQWVHGCAGCLAIIYLQCLGLSVSSCPILAFTVESWGLPGLDLQAAPSPQSDAARTPWPGGLEAEPPLARRAGSPFQTGEWSRSLEAPAREAGVKRALLSSLRLSCLEMPRQSSISGPRFSYLGSGHLDWTFPWVSPRSDFSPKRQCSPELGMWPPGLADWVHTQPCPFLPAWSWAGEPRG